MMASISQPDLLAALRAALLVIPRKAGLPILENVHLRAGDGTLVVSATDLETYAQFTVPCVCSLPFSACAPARALYETVAGIPGGSIDLELVDWHWRIRSDVVGFTGKIAGIDSSDFPEAPVRSTEHRIAFHPRDLDAVYEKVAFAVSDDPTRPVLHGVCLRRVRKHAEVCATDGHRLARLPLPDSAFEEMAGTEWILPAHLIQLALRLAYEGEVIAANFAEDVVEFVPPPAAPFLEVRLWGKLVGGPYPDISRVIPTSTAWTMVFDRNDLLRTARRVRAASRGDQQSRLLLDCAPGRAKVHGRGNGIEGFDSLPIQGGTLSESINLAFNCEYVIEVLGMFSGITIEMAGNAPNQATIWREPGNDAKSLFLILMPIRRDRE